MSQAKNLTQHSCPCASGRAYRDCCQRWHHGPQRLQAPDAEVLMRSRYSAYVLDELQYLLDTWHPDTRPTQLEPNPPGLKWLGLQVKQHQQHNADHATVEFVARCRQASGATRLHEISRFTRRNGEWLYLDGHHP